MKSILRSAMLLLASIVLAACPAPPDGAGPSAGTPDAPRSEPTPSAPQLPGGAAPASNPPSPGTPVAGGGATTVARATDRTEPVVYEHLRGGIWVARCPECGEVQAAGATACPGCGQALSPWRKEVVCTRCVGDGRCDHCGDDRVCLVCDGDGACTTCGGVGKSADRGVQCADCRGSGRCTVCRGDGLRESVAGDFGPSEGWLPGACAMCIDGSGLCPDCGSTGKDRTGGACATCGGNGVCPECAGEGSCAWCATDGACTVCEGSGFEVRNGETRGPAERVRTLRTSAGSLLRGRVDGEPSPQGLRVVREEGGNAVASTMSYAQIHPLTWFLVARDFAPAWDGRTTAQLDQLSKFRSDLADRAADQRYWPLAIQSLREAIAADPLRSAQIRTRLQDIETRRVEDWMKRADAAQKAATQDRTERDRAVVLLEMIVFKGRGSALATRAELQLLGIRKDREVEEAKLDSTVRVQLATDAKASIARALVRARGRLERSRKLLATATRAGPDDVGADRTFARAEQAAATARRLVQIEAVRNPPGVTPWPQPIDAVVTESRLASVSVLEAWTARAAGGGRFDLAMRVVRRGLAIDPANERLQQLLGMAEAGLARAGVSQGTAPPSKR